LLVYFSTAPGFSGADFLARTDDGHACSIRSHAARVQTRMDRREKSAFDVCSVQGQLLSGSAKANGRPMAGMYRVVDAVL